MATIRELLKGKEVWTVQADQTVFDAAHEMGRRNVGAVPVLHGANLIGVFSERDILQRVVMEKRDPYTTHVRDVMTCDPQIVGPEDSVERCMVMMKQHGFRHLPVCHGAELIGFLSMRDLLLHDLDEKEVEVKMMREYMAAGAE